jgi:hypothetical protein
MEAQKDYDRTQIDTNIILSLYNNQMSFINMILDYNEKNLDFWKNISKLQNNYYSLRKYSMELFIKLNAIDNHYNYIT